MVNLLPHESRAHAKSRYRGRFFSAAALALAGAFLVGTAFLLPAYFLASESRAAAAAQSSVAQQSLSQSTFAEAADAERSTEGLYLAAQSVLAAPRPSVVLQSLLGAVPAGISLRHIDVSTKNASEESIDFSGIADTRDDLLALKSALAAVPGVVDVDLPVDSLAAASDVPFSITVTDAASSTTP